MDKKQIGAIELTGALSVGAVVGEDRRHIETNVNREQSVGLEGQILISTSAATATPAIMLTGSFRK